MKKGEAVSKYTASDCTEESEEEEVDEFGVEVKSIELVM